MSGPRIVCVNCGKPTDSILSPICSDCGVPAKGSDQHAGQMIAARSVLNGVTVPGNENVAACIAAELARIDGFDPDDANGGLYDLRWSGGPTPEPEGDAWNMDYLPKGERIASALARELDAQPHAATSAGGEPEPSNPRPPAPQASLQTTASP